MSKIADILKKAQAQAQAAAAARAAQVEANRDIMGAQSGEHTNGERRDNSDVWWNGSWHLIKDYNALIAPTQTGVASLELSQFGAVDRIQQWVYKAENAETQADYDYALAQLQEAEDAAARAQKRAAKKAKTMVTIQKVGFGVAAAVITAGAASAIAGVTSAAGSSSTVAAVTGEIKAIEKKVDDIKKDVPLLDKVNTDISTITPLFNLPNATIKPPMAGIVAPTTTAELPASRPSIIPGPPRPVTVSEDWLTSLINSIFALFGA